MARIKYSKNPEYFSYLKKARRKLKSTDILTEKQFMGAKLAASMKETDFSIAELVKRQSQGGYSDKQIDAKWEAHKRMFPGKFATRNQFIKEGGLKDLEKEFERRKNENGSESDYIIWRSIMSPQL